MIYLGYACVVHSVMFGTHFIQLSVKSSGMMHKNISIGLVHIIMALCGTQRHIMCGTHD